MASTDQQCRLLSLPARVGAASVARSQLEQVCEAAARLHGAAADNDGTALHDFRVGLRRLRSTLRTYERVLYDWVGPAWHRRVGKLARLTNAARDTEVQRLWLHRHRQALPVEHQPVIDILAARLGDDEAQTAARRRRVFERFAALELALTSLLAPRSEEAETEAENEPTFAAVTAERLRRLTHTLHKRLVRIAPGKSPRAADRIHRARIAGKRLRYALEPLRDEVPAAAELVGTLESFQDISGVLNDQYLLAHRLRKASRKATRHQRRRTRKRERTADAPTTPPAPAIAASIALLRDLLADEHRAELERLRTLWLGDASAPFFAAVAALADQIDAG